MVPALWDWRRAHPLVTFHPMTIPHSISLMIVFPVLGALIQWGFSLVKKTEIPWVSLLASLISSVLGFVMIFTMNIESDLQFTESFHWIEQLGIKYEMGIDGLSALLVLLISIAYPVLIAAEWKRPKGLGGLHGLFLISQATAIACVCSQDLFLMFFFWALLIVPVYFQVGIWGESTQEGQNESTAMQTMMTGAIGNALCFAGLVLVYHALEPNTFLIQDFIGAKLSDKSIDVWGRSLKISGLAFGLFAAGLALRIPFWPMHRWFLNVTKNAPASVVASVCIVSVSVGLYLFLRISFSLFPDVLKEIQPWIVGFGVVNLVLGSIGALAHKNLRLLICYTLLIELGLLLISIGALGASALVGVVYQLLSIGLGWSAFILLVGYLGDSPGGGLAFHTPILALIMGLTLSTMIGVPGSAGFVGHSLELIGSFSHLKAEVISGGIALLIMTYALITLYKRIFLGSAETSSGSSSPALVDDLDTRRKLYLIPLALCAIVFGVYPKILIDIVRPTALTLLSLLN